MKDERLMFCDRCHKSASMSDMKYVQRGNNTILLCSKCREQSTKLVSNIPKKVLEKKSPKKGVYYCGRCKYKFDFDETSLISLRCPYCGRADKVGKHRVLSANDIVEMADKE